MKISSTHRAGRRLGAVAATATIGVTSMWAGGNAANADDIEVDIPLPLLEFTTTILGGLNVYGIDVDIDFSALESASFNAVQAPGAKLSTFVVEPAGPGPHPIMLMPAPWNMTGAIYAAQAGKFAEEGFLVLAYTPRGAWLSGGVIDVAGPDTINDVSVLIDWAIDNKNGDGNRVGTAGISYGAGIGLLAIAEEPRIDAVISMSGWADFEDIYYPNQTLYSQGANNIFENTFTNNGLGGPNLTARPGQDLFDMRTDFNRGEVAAGLKIFSSRSPSTDIDAINRSGAAVMISHGYNDTGFPVGQMVDFFEELTVEKKIIVQPGVHFVNEASGLVGQQNLAWDEALKFAKQHVMGVDTDTGYVVTAFDHDDSNRIAYGNTWDQVTANRVENFYLTDASGLLEEGDLRSTPSTGWDESIPEAGQNTTADSLTKEEVTQTVARDTKNATWLPGIDRDRAVVWRSDKMPSTRQLSGRPELTITVEPRESDFTVFAYLYEEYGRWGYGKLISHEPYTVRGGASGRDVTINLEMEPIVWEVNEGNRLVLVIDTVDANYLSETDAKMYLESTPGNPAVLSIPWR